MGTWKEETSGSKGGVSSFHVPIFLLASYGNGKNTRAILPPLFSQNGHSDNCDATSFGSIRAHAKVRIDRHRKALSCFGHVFSPNLLTSLNHVLNVWQDSSYRL